MALYSSVLRYIKIVESVWSNRRGIGHTWWQVKLAATDAVVLMASEHLQLQGWHLWLIHLTFALDPHWIIWHRSRCLCAAYIWTVPLSIERILYITVMLYLWLTSATLAVDLQVKFFCWFSVRSFLFWMFTMLRSCPSSVFIFWSKSPLFMGRSVWIVTWYDDALHDTKLWFAYSLKYTSLFVVFLQMISFKKSRLALCMAVYFSVILCYLVMW